MTRKPRMFGTYAKMLSKVRWAESPTLSARGWVTTLLQAIGMRDCRQHGCSRSSETRVHGVSEPAAEVHSLAEREPPGLAGRRRRNLCKSWPRVVIRSRRGTRLRTDHRPGFAAAGSTGAHPAF